ncbi:ABC transporter substrate-binding protein [Oscillospiraceae bacterium OttesenSCG-928-F05]|nr:ABC transporter substrate-binding protein [Oscillospiraceae bacterium OttesenSCG-928-F05]
MKKLSCVFLAVLLVFSLAACGGNTTPSTAPTATPAVTGAPVATDTPTQEPVGDPVELNVVSYYYGTITDLAKVEEAINAISLPATNTTVKLVLHNGSAFQEQIGLSFAAQEKIDLLNGGTTYPFYADHVGKGYYEPLDDLLDQYGQEIKSDLTDKYIGIGRSADGYIYGVSAMRDLAAGACVLARTDLVDKYSMDFSAVKGVADMEPFLQTILDNEDNMIPISTARQSKDFFSYFTHVWEMDKLGSTDNIGIMHPFDSTDIELLIATDEYMEDMMLVRDFYNKGFLPEDGVADTTNGRDYLKNGRMFAYIGTHHANALPQARQRAGMDMTLVNIAPFRANTQSTTNSMWSIPIFAEDPVASMKFLNLTFESAELVNILIYGVEGLHWEFTDDNVHIRYPDGVSNDNVGYMLGINWCWGDQFQSHPWEGDATDTWTKMNDDNLSARASLATGFIYDTSAQKTTYSGLSGIVQEFEPALGAGMVDPATVIPEFVRKMQDGGADDIIADKQAQLDAWLQNQ